MNKKHNYWLVFPKKRFNGIANGWQSAGEPFIFNRAITADNLKALHERAREYSQDYEKLELHQLDRTATHTIDLVN